MAQKLIIDAETGEQTFIDLTPEEETERGQREAAHAERVRDQDARQALLDRSRPNAATIKAVQDGTPLTPAQLESAVRWLLLREFAEATV